MISSRWIHFLIFAQVSLKYSQFQVEFQLLGSRNQIYKLKKYFFANVCRLKIGFIVNIRWIRA